ncbi:hypothetical protein CY35_14G083500 [Sphagnum magellanicum]|nr:hypothetical protein CY35_14G083500 [Sphagnum magellanicum]
MLFNENGGGSVLVVDREVSSYGVYVAVAGRQPLSPSTLTNTQQRTEELAAVADSSNGCNSVGSSSSTGRSLRRMMGSPGGLFDGRRSGGGGGGRSNSSVTLEALESVVMRVIDRVREYGYGEDVCSDLQEHFAYLSSRYTLNIDPERHEDVLLHMRLLQAARKAAEEAGGSRGSSILLDEQTSSSAGPFINVRKVQLWSAVDMSVMMSGRNSPLQNNGTGSGCWGLKIPKPAFGSCSNLASLGCGASPKVHPSSGGGSLTRLAFGNWGTLQPTPPGSTDRACSRPAFGSFTNPLHMDEDGAGYNSDNEDSGPTYGYEITLATSDRHGLLRHYTTAISNIKTELNIKEAHVFSTTDGMALEVFVVEGWDGDDADELRWAVLLALDVKEEWLPKYIDAKLKAAAESIQYEDWAVDYNLLVIGEKLGKGSSGQLYRGKYMSQDVAIKMIALDNDHDMGTQGADSLRAFPASELLHTFKQEVSIMRLVRHKNLVQFIGACSCWPRLCIVTELMSGGSVRDVLEFQMGGLDIPSAVKVLRDAARGMDFLHKKCETGCSVEKVCSVKLGETVPKGE